MIERRELPTLASLRKYLLEGAYADCYATILEARVGHAEYVEAFYTTWLFKIERRLLAWFVAKPSSDAEARQLARGERDAFAAWSVEARVEDQLLMCDFQGRTRSWLMVEAIAEQPGATRLYFGSAVVPKVHSANGERRMGAVFALLLGFHKLYSRALLSAAKSRLRRHPS